MKKLIAGNWKMNCNSQEAKTLIADIINSLYANEELLTDFDFLVCPPFIYIPTLRHALLNHAFLKYGAQDCSENDNGAFTGDVSARMLSETGCASVILGHSERRQYHGELNDTVKKKLLKAHSNKLQAIVCVGESEADRDAGKHIEHVTKQIEECLHDGCDSTNTVVAYEPIWAIGTGKTASRGDIEEMHVAIQQKLKEKLADGVNIRILYGGSVKPSNAMEILSIKEVGGCLVGGASLDPDSFIGIAKAYNT